MLKKILLILALFSALFADIPTGYYDGTEGLSGESLKFVLNNIIDNHDELSYDDLRDFVLENTDEDPNNSNNLILFYTGRSQNKSTFGGGADQWNREHVWAKSHGDFGNNPPCGTDAHHIRPTDASVNSTRGNKDFDDGGNAIYDNGYLAGWTDGDSWEPRDDVKGDVARIIFYMATRYEGEGGELDLEVIDAVNTDPNPQHGKLSTLLEWNTFDPPDEFEQNRNDQIYYYQDNRNPFIDHPEFVNYIWGNEAPELMANFTANANSGNIPFTVSFTDISSGGAEIVSWDWDFDNDGSIDSNSQDPSYTFTSEGSFTVSLTVTDNLGNSDNETKIDFIAALNTELPIEIYATSFESTIADWEIFSTASTNDWERSNQTDSSHPSAAQNGSWYAHMNNYGADEPAEDWLISPSFNLANYNDIFCNFYVWTKYSDSITGLELLVTNNFSGNLNTTNWTNLNTPFYSVADEIWTSFANIDLNNFADETVRIAFKYESSGTSGGQAKAWAMDSFQIFGTDVILYGDVDGNGEVQAYDASLTLQKVIELIDFETWQITAADVDGNGEIQAYDASLILQYLAGLIDNFPVE
ncbi:MAG: PKD domain-containing protein [Candidatus Cloacimonetes bacterium]|jgi:endonuclease I|nr:PKD domain-containing protein [Candidatus Cloacimonadota bacterium]MBT6994262.1 PKD domain-containing protein [Candidatus Cloacimonadota bacterium]MBT7469153.1 PKD domain-containing protein [Candidatus Cloacimonadota bacterium]